MKKILDYQIRSEVLGKNPLHRVHFAYQTGKSTVMALSGLVNRIKKVVTYKKNALCAFVDIEGTIDNTFYGPIERAVIRKRVPLFTIKWIRSMLEHREITARLGGESVT